jgi:hypothetical protein
MVQQAAEFQLLLTMLAGTIALHFDSSNAGCHAQMSKWHIPV